MYNKKTKSLRKIGVIGCGHVGVSFVYFAMANSLASEFVLIDVSESLRDGHAMDFQDAISSTSQEVKVYAGDYSNLKDADLIFISAGRPYQEGDTRLDMLKANKLIITQIANDVRESGFQGVVLIASNPVDIITYIFYKESGFPRNKVIGSGTILDSARLTYLISQDCKVSTKVIDAFVIGEHGDSSLVAFSQIRVGGQNYLEFKDQLRTLECCKCCTCAPCSCQSCDCCSCESCQCLQDSQPIFTHQNYEELLEKVVARRGYEVMIRKRSTNFGIGACMAKIAEAVLNNSHAILPVGPVLSGEYGYENIVFGTPCVVGQQGIHKIIELPLNQKEKDKLKKSTEVLYSYLKSIGY